MFSQVFRHCDGSMFNIDKNLGGNVNILGQADAQLCKMRRDDKDDSRYHPATRYAV